MMIVELAIVDFRRPHVLTGAGIGRPTYKFLGSRNTHSARQGKAGKAPAEPQNAFGSAGASPPRPPLDLALQNALAHHETSVLKRSSF